MGCNSATPPRAETFRHPLFHSICVAVRIAACWDADRRLRTSDRKLRTAGREKGGGLSSAPGGGLRKPCPLVGFVFEKQPWFLAWLSRCRLAFCWLAQDARPGPGPSGGVAVAAHVLRAGYLALAGSVKVRGPGVGPPDGVANGLALSDLPPLIGFKTPD